MSKARYFINYTTKNYLIDYANVGYLKNRGYTEVSEFVYRQFEKERLEEIEKELRNEEVKPNN